MKKVLILLAIVVLILSLEFTSHAQETVHISSIQVEIWPEYDQPAILVIYHIYLAEDTTLPTILNLRVPAGAEVAAVAVENPEAGLVLTEYTRTVSEEWATLSITALTPTIQVEYYDVLEKEGSQRQINYVWSGNVAVDAFTLIFQNPVGAMDIKLHPEPVSNQLGLYDLRYSKLETIVLDLGEGFNFQATYGKSNDELSISSLTVVPSAPLEETDGHLNWDSILPWILGVLGLIFLAMGFIVLFAFKGRTTNIRKKKNYHHTRQASQKFKVNNEKLSIYCSGCGKQAERGDQFCRSCGKQLRNRVN